MKENSYHLAVDLGATSGRVMLACFDSHKVEMEEVSRFRYPMLPIAGHLFWNLPLIFQEVKEAADGVISRLTSLNANLSSIGIDTWGCDVAYFNADGTLAGLPYCYRDPHTAGAVERFGQKIPLEELYRRTGIQFMDFNTLFQLDTIHPDADRILFMSDALAYMLTGEAVSEFTVASTSQMLDLSTGDYDPELLEMVGLNRTQFGRMVQPAEIIGHYRDVPVVAVAGHDTASAVIGIPSPDKDYAYLSCGTWALLGVEATRPNSGAKAFQYNFTNEGGLHGTTRLLKNICSMWIFERVRNELDHDRTDVNALAASSLNSQLATIINPDDPAFANPESMTAAIQQYCKARGLEAPQTLADYIRVIYRSLAARVAEVLGWLREIAPNEIRRLHVIGGGSRNAHLMQMLATATGLPVVAGPAESTALGNALVQISAVCKDKVVNLKQIAINSTETTIYQP